MTNTSYNNSIYSALDIVTLNKYIIENNISPKLKTTNNLVKSPFLIVSREARQIRACKQLLLSKSQAIATDNILSLDALYKKLFNKLVLSPNNKDYTNTSSLNDYTSQMIIKGILTKVKNKESNSTSKSVSSISNFQSDLLKIVNNIKSFYPEDAKQHYLIIGICNTLSKWRSALTTKYPNLKLKYNLIYDILHEYEFIQKKSKLVDKNDMIYSLILALEDKNKNKNILKDIKHIYLLAFEYLTNLELAFIRQLLKQGITLTISIFHDDSIQNTFYKTSKLIKDLLKMGFTRKTIDRFKDIGMDETQGIIKDKLFMPYNNTQSRIAKDSINNLTKESVLPKLYLLEETNIEQEIIAISKQIVTLLSNGVRPEDIYVACREQREYENEILKQFKIHNIPIKGTKRINLLDSKLIRTILNILLLRIYNFDYDMLIRFISSGYVSLGFPKGFSTENKIKHYWRGTRNTSLLKYFRDLKASKETLSQNENEEDEKHKYNSKKEIFEINLILKCLERLYAIINEFPAPNEKRPLKELTNKLKDHIIKSFMILQNCYMGNDIKRVKEDSHILKRFMDTLNELVYIMTKDDKSNITIVELYGILYTAMQSSRIKIEQDSVKGVIYGGEQVPLDRFKYVFVAGMTDKSFPIVSRDLNLLTTIEEIEINKLIKGLFKTSEERQHDENIVFLKLLLMAENGVYFSYPEFSNGGQTLNRSFYLDELPKSLLNKIIRDENYIHSQDELYSYYAKKIASENNIFNNIDAIMSFPKDEIENIKAIVEMEKKRLSNKHFSEYEGYLDLSERDIRINLLKDKLNLSISPTKLELYGQCPHRYFFSDILKLKEIREEVFELTGSRKGSIIHDILEEFYKRHKVTDKEVYLECILNKDKSKRKKARRKKEEFKLKEKIKLELLKIITVYVENEIRENRLSQLFKEGIQLQELQEDIIHFVTQDIKENSEYSKDLLEYNFSEDDKHIIEYKDNTIYIKGKIDRIDLSKDCKTIRVIDYKTGQAALRNELVEKALAGLNFQHPLYSKVAKDIYKSSRLEYSANYYIPSNKDSIKSREFIAEDKIDESGITYIDKALAYTKNYLNMIENGRFPSNPRQHKCPEYCEYQEICRVNLDKAILKDKNTMFWESIIE